MYRIQALLGGIHGKCSGQGVGCLVEHQRVNAVLYDNLA
ncbi:MAG: hypothetical protein FD159_2736, partial [Syntrophaceae bacterium]